MNMVFLLPALGFLFNIVVSLTFTATKKSAGSFVWLQIPFSKGRGNKISSPSPTCWRGVGGEVFLGFSLSLHVTS